MISTMRNTSAQHPFQNPFIPLPQLDNIPQPVLSTHLPSKKSSRNMKKLSITLPTNDLPPTLPLPPNPVARPRRPSIVSLPPITSSLMHRKDEDLASPSIPYADGPVQIIPGIWLGSEENARDWNGLIERGIKSVLNVAKEVASPFDAATKSLRTVSSTPNFRNSYDQDPTYYPPHIASGRPPMHYLKLQWSHGQQDLVDNGFLEAMHFTDAALERSEGILIQSVIPPFLLAFCSILPLLKAVNVASRGRLLWLLPWSCAQPQKTPPRFLPRSGL
jgi:tyrosine-protein phosphatase